MSNETHNGTSVSVEPAPWYPLEGTPLAGQIGGNLSDFVVDEVPLYAPSGEGEHLYLRLQKRGIPTRALVREVASHAGCSQRDVGYAGMKDTHAVTTQWVSVPKGADPATWEWSERVRYLESAMHTNKLRTGHLAGNRFRIRLVGVFDIDALRARIDAICSHGALNGFDRQRFGRDGQNLSRALAWARGEGGRTSKFERKLYASVLQSHVFNRVASMRAHRDLLDVHKGDVLRLEGSSSVFVCEDPQIDEQRRQRGELHLTGPIFGPKARMGTDIPLEIEREAISELDLDDAALSRVARHGRGTRRDIFAPIKDLALDIENAQTVTLSFYLASGSYATNILRHVLRIHWDEPLRASADGGNV